MKKLIALLIAVLLLGTFLVACGDDDNETSSQAASSQAQESSAEETEDESSEQQESSEEQLGLPDTFWGTTLVMLVNKTRKYMEYEFWYNEETEDLVASAVVDRTNKIKEDYGIEIQMQYIDALGGTIQEVEKAISANLPLDLVADGAKYLAPSSLNGWYYDLIEENEQYNYLQLDASWWDQPTIRDLSFGGKLFFLTGDICIADDYSTWGLFFNKGLIEDYGLESPYTLVKENKWTIDTVHEMAKKVNLKHGETMSYEPSVGDIWGMVAQSYDGLMFMAGCRQTMVTKDNDDFPIIRIKEEQNENAWNKVFDLLTDMDYIGVADFFGSYNSGVYGKELEIFVNGNALFMPNALSVLDDEKFVNTEVDYGLVPMPKYSENQDEYSSSVTYYWLKVVAIPLSNIEKVDCAMFALEALAYYGQKMVTPKFYQQVLKGQKVKDEESEEMLDLIFRNRTYDMAGVYDFGTNTVVMIQFYTSLLMAKTENRFTSLYDTNKVTYQEAIDKAILTFMGEDQN